MKGRLCAAVAAFTLALVFAAPLDAAEQVRGMTAPNTSAAQTATTTNSAVVDKGLTSTTITVPASTEPQEYKVDLKPLIDGLMPYFIAGFGGLITVIFSVTGLYLKQKWGIEIDKSQRDALQSAASNAAGALIARGAVWADQHGTISVKSEDMAHVMNVAAERVPDAIKRFALTPEQLQNLIIAKIPQLPVNPPANPPPGA